MTARRSVGDQLPACQAIGCRQSASAPAVEVLVPASGGMELELQLCSEHRDEVERALEAAMDAVFQAGLEAVQTAIRAGWGGLIW
jgi:hypothetical protein